MAQHLCVCGGVGGVRCLLNPCSTTHNIFVREPLAIFHQVTWVYMVFYRKPHNTLSKIDFLSNLYCWFIIIELSQQHCPSHLNKVCLIPSFPIRYTIVFQCWRTSENTLVSCLESLLNCKSTNKKAQKKGMLKKRTAVYCTRAEQEIKCCLGHVHVGQLTDFTPTCVQTSGFRNVPLFITKFQPSW